jgi:hypothetical protein
MDKFAVAIKTLRTRADAFRTNAESCNLPRYSELMRKGATHLYEQARLLEAHLECQPPVELEMQLQIDGTDR